MDSPADTPARYRCTACGNLTRFEVTVTRRTRSFHHYTIGGELSVEDTEVLSEDVESVICRWCGTGASVEALEDAATDTAPADTAPTDTAPTDTAPTDTAPTDAPSGV